MSRYILSGIYLFRHNESVENVLICRYCCKTNTGIKLPALARLSQSDKQGKKNCQKKEVQADDGTLMGLEKFIGTLNQRQSTKEAAESIQGNGLVVTCGRALEGDHGRECKEVIALFLEQGVIGNTRPGMAQ